MGIASIGEQLPAPVYALLSGLNAATVGVIALAAVQLSQKAVTDKLTRILVFLGGTAGMLYNALWYFPLMMLFGGAATIIWDLRLGHMLVGRFRSNTGTIDRDTEAHVDSVAMNEVAPSDVPVGRNTPNSVQSRRIPSSDNTDPVNENPERNVPISVGWRVFSWKFGLTVIACFFATFTVIMTLRGVLKHRPRGFNLFANLYLAGTLSPSVPFSKKIR